MSLRIKYELSIMYLLPDTDEFEISRDGFSCKTRSIITWFGGM